MSNGLTDKDKKILIEKFKKIPEIEKVIFFGSRALGNHKKGSDIDICIKGKKITQDITSHLHYILEEETTLPYFFDVINYNTINNKDLITHIDTKGEVFFKR